MPTTAQAAGWLCALVIDKAPYDPWWSLFVVRKRSTQPFGVAQSRRLLGVGDDVPEEET